MQVEKNPYPVFLNLSGQAVLIVGAGSVGLRKAQGVLAAGAVVTVVSPEFSDLWDSVVGAVTRVAEAYRAGAAGHMAAGDWRLVFAATNQPRVNAAVARDAAAAGILCCRCDAPDQGDFSGGAMWQQAGLTLAVSTNGSSPVLSRRIRDACVDAMDPIFSQWAQLLAVWRPQVLRQVRDPALRQLLLRGIAGPEMEQVLREHGPHGPGGAQAVFERWLTESRLARNDEELRDAR